MRSDWMTCSNGNQCQRNGLRAVSCRVWFRIDKRRKSDMPVAIKRVIRAKRDDVAAWKNVRQTALHHAAHVECVRIQKCRDCHTQRVLAGELACQSLNDKLIERGIRRPTAIRAAATATGGGQVFLN